MAALLPIVICLGMCPVMMYFMMKGMGSKESAGKTKPDRAPEPAPAKLSREEQLVELNAQLANSQAQRQKLARELDQVERGASPVGRGADGTRVTRERDRHRS